MATEKEKDVFEEVKNLTEKMFSQWEGSFKNIMDKVVTEGKITKTEGKKLIQEYSDQFKTERVKLEERFDKEMNKVLKKVVRPTRKKLQEVTSKLASLEDEINKMEN